MDELKRFQSLKRTSDERQREEAKLQGRLEELLEQLQEFGCKTEKEAKALLRKKQDEKEKVRSKLDRLLSQFEEEFADEL